MKYVDELIWLMEIRFHGFNKVEHRRICLSVFRSKAETRKIYQTEIRFTLQSESNRFMSRYLYIQITNIYIYCLFTVAYSLEPHLIRRRKHNNINLINNKYNSQQLFSPLEICSSM